MVKKEEMLKEFEKNCKVLQEDINENEKLMNESKDKAEGIRKTLSEMIKGGVKAQ